MCDSTDGDYISMTNQVTISVVYLTESGTARLLAEDLEARLRSNGKSCRLIDAREPMSQDTLYNLVFKRHSDDDSVTVFIVSTSGNTQLFISTNLYRPRIYAVEMRSLLGRFL